MGALWLTGTDANLRPGDRLLIVGAKSGGGLRDAGLRRVQAVDKDDLNKRTQVTFELLDYGPTPVTADAPASGRCAPGPRRSATTRRKSQLRKPSQPGWRRRMGSRRADSADLKRLTLDAVYDQIVVGGWVVVDRPASAWTVIDFD